MKRCALLPALLTVACGGHGTAAGGADVAIDDAGWAGGAEAAVDQSPAVEVARAPSWPDSGGATSDWAGEAGGRDFGTVTALVEQRAAAAGVTSMGLAIWDARDTKVYEHMLGGFTLDTRVAVASASKLVSGLVLFDVVRRGLLTLDATTGQVLSWPLPNAAITLRQLLSFTSGLPREAACTVNPLTTLANCANTMSTATAVAGPGTEFDYGSTHLLVAAAMAEQVTGQRWDDLFAQTLQAPLGLPDEVSYFTGPRQAVGKLNPLVAGGLRASMNEYHHLLALAFHRGNYRGLTIGSPALFDEQAREPYPDAVIGYSPMPTVTYGLACWLYCATPETGCQQLASPGAFGFTPWLDRAAGYYAILGMELESTGNDEGVVAFAVGLQKELLPLIAEEMAK